MSDAASDRVQAAYLRACQLDVLARKPGNVSVASPGHGMDAALFLASAQASAAAVCARGLGIGERIEAAVRATLAVAHCNTNLGIVLLCAPIAAACEGWDPASGIGGLRAAVVAVLAALDVDDARAAYRAIAAAKPGGLGHAPAQDVADEPTVSLHAAMALAAERDRIAAQYANGMRDLFDLGQPAFAAGRAAGLAGGANDAEADMRGMQRAYLEFLAALADSHIVRKHGEALAQSVMTQARPWREHARRGTALDADPAYEAWDSALKAHSINPGTSADLAVASAFLGFLIDLGSETAERP